MRSVAFGLAVFLATASASAAPDGAAWGAADPSSAQTCSSCHFDNEPIEQSDAISFSGLAREIESDMTYDLVLGFTKQEAPVAGFLITANTGVFSSAGNADLETKDKEIRSISTWRAGDRALWGMQWRSPKALPEEIVFYIAANAGNDDASPFGDKIHYREYVFEIAGGQ